MGIMLKNIFLKNVFFIAVFFIFSHQVNAETSTVVYDFNYDSVGTAPLNITPLTENATMTVEYSSAFGSNVVKNDSYGTTPPAVFSFNDFPTSEYQQIVWKNAYTNNTWRGGFILRGSVDQNGMINGYLFQINPALSNGKIFSVTNGVNTLLATYPFSAQGPNIARYYRATANGNTLTLERSANGTTWVFLGSVTNSTYVSGGVYYAEGYGANSGQSIAGNTYNDNILYTYDSGPVIIDPPGEPQNLTVTNATPTSISLSWTAPNSDGGSPIVDYEIDYKLSSDNLWSNFNDGLTTNTNVTVTGLSPNTSYDFRVSALNIVGKGNVSPVVTTTTPNILVTGTISITSPVSYRVFQRNSSNVSDIAISGTYTGGPVNAIEAKFGNGPWVIIDDLLEGGSFSGVLYNQPVGQGDVSVRFTSNVNITASKNYIGVGDIYVVAGQSNASGRGKTNQVYSHPTLKASLFGNDDVWKHLTDPHDKNINQVDVVSSDPLAKGSFVPHLATHILSNTSIPIAFIPASMGGTSMEQWSPAGELYASMARRINAVGGNIKAVLWFQGESDSSATGVVGYVDQLNEFVDSVYAEFGAPTVIGMLGSATSNGEGRSYVRIAQKEVIETNSHAVQGPAMYDVNIDDETCDGTHFCSNNDLQIFGTRWWYALSKAFYGGTDGFGPKVVDNSIIYDQSDNAIYMDFSDDSVPIITTPQITNPAVFKVYNGTSARTVASVVYIDDNTIKLNMGATPIYPSNGLTVSYAVDNRSGILNAIYDSLGLPAMNFRNTPVTIQN
jgi:hypothetical protein